MNWMDFILGLILGLVVGCIATGLFFTYFDNK